MVLLYILIFILVLGIVICFHEFGHFFFAKKAGVQVNEFAFGMGPKLLSKKKGETYWSIRAFPIGGFCAMAGEDEALSLLNVGDQVRLVLNDQNKVTKIILKHTEEEFKDLPLITVEKFDLLGENMAPLYINDYEVCRDCLVYYSKKNEVQIAPYEKTFFAKKVWQRFLICLGGPLNNLILALFTMLVLGLIVGVGVANTSTLGSTSGAAYEAGLRKGDTILTIDGYDINSEYGFSGDEMKEGSFAYAIYTSTNRAMPIIYLRDGKEYSTTVYASYAFNNLGISSYDENINESNAEKVSVIVETKAALGGTNKSKAYQAENGLRNGDVILTAYYYGDSELSIKDTKTIESWNDLYLFATSEEVLGGGNVAFEYLRDGEKHTTGVYSVYSNQLLESQGYSAVNKYIGISAPTKFSLGVGLLNGLRLFWKAIATVFSTLFLLFSSKEVGINSLGGFITILNQVASTTASGFENLLYFIGFLSVSLGIMNLLPIPALDGGRILFLFIEGVTGKKINPKVESIIINVVFVLLLILIGYVLVQDVIRLVIQLK